jgi:hypothetical protein
MCLSFFKYEISNVRFYYNFHTKINMKLQSISLCQFREKYEDIYCQNQVIWSAHTKNMILNYDKLELHFSQWNE